MGKCCTKPKPKAKPVPEPKSPTPELPPPKHIFIECAEPHYKAKLLYSPDKPISDLLDQIDIPTQNYILCKGTLQITDFTATLRQLGISPNITLNLTKPEIEEEKLPVHQTEASIMHQSLEEIAEEETTPRKEIEAIIPKQATRVMERQENQASTL